MFENHWCRVFLMLYITVSKFFYRWNTETGDRSNMKFIISMIDGKLHSESWFGKCMFLKVAPVMIRA
jgi:hypothetical protein